jgi:diacylglycerol kinase (ATP)
MTSVAVIAHTGKSLGGGLNELRETLAAHGVSDPLWFEVPKSRKAPKAAQRAVSDGADLVFVWGGDGMVQRCIDTLAGTGATLAIVPAGTANLLASNLDIPKHIEDAVAIGLHGQRRPLDVGVLNGERFAVMAGTGFDALMIRDADNGLKDKLGRAAYVWTGLKHVNRSAVGMRIKIDGATWFEGDATCVLLGNVGTITGGITAFDDARPDDGLLDVGVVTADSAVQWARVLGRMVASRSEKSPFVQVAQGRKIKVNLDRAMPFELDGGDRPETEHLRAHVEPHAITVCVPQKEDGR